MEIDNTIVDKVLDNEATPEETKEALRWFETNEGQTALSHRLTRETTLLTLRQANTWLNHPVPTERMRTRFLTAIRQSTARMRWWWAAAVLVPLFVMGGALTFIADRVGLFSAVQYAEIVVPCGQQMQVLLPDGTALQLNSDSRLRYPKTFSLFSRRVSLEGEGYFNVVKDKNRPFLVDLKGLEVKVTGTEFNVKAYATDPNIYVTLNAGSVVLQDSKNRKYTLVPGESAMYSRQSGACRITKPEHIETIQAWRTNSMNFYLTPLKEIIKVMEHQYDTRFIVKDSSLLNNRFTFSTTKVNIADVLQDLEKVSQTRFIELEKNVFEITQKEK